jgi:hypothetical protein
VPGSSGAATVVLARDSFADRGNVTGQFDTQDLASHITLNGNGVTRGLSPDHHLFADDN